MHRIRPWLYIGSFRDSRNHSLLAVERIGAILHVADTISHPTLEVVCLPIEDGQPVDYAILRQGLDFIHAQREAGQTVLVACGAGISRSTTFALAALKEHEQTTLIETLRSIREPHPEAAPHYALWQSLGAFFDEPISLEGYLKLLR